MAIFSLKTSCSKKSENGIVNKTPNSKFIIFFIVTSNLRIDSIVNIAISTFSKMMVKRTIVLNFWHSQ